MKIPPFEITYTCEPELPAAEFIDVLKRSTLGERRPIADPSRMAGMLRNADLIVTAREPAGKLIGISRALTDFEFCTYLSDLAVDQEFQGFGIGRELIHRTHSAAGVKTQLILIAAPRARTYYPHIGMRGHDSCWVIDRQE